MDGRVPACSVTIRGGYCEYDSSLSHDECREVWLGFGPIFELNVDVVFSYGKSGTEPGTGEFAKLSPEFLYISISHSISKVYPLFRARVQPTSLLAPSRLGESLLLQ